MKDFGVCFFFFLVHSLFSLNESIKRTLFLFPFECLLHFDQSQETQKKFKRNEMPYKIDINLFFIFSFCSFAFNYHLFVYDLIWRYREGRHRLNVWSFCHTLVQYNWISTSAYYVFGMFDGTLHTTIKINSVFDLCNWLLSSFALDVLLHFFFPFSFSLCVHRHRENMVAMYNIVIIIIAFGFSFSI